MKKFSFLLLLSLIVPIGVDAAQDPDWSLGVREQIMRWQDVWQQKNLEQYMQNYHPEFRSGSKDRAAWQSSKAAVFEKPGEITVKISELKVWADSAQAIAVFVQHYRQANMRDVGSKQLVWFKTDSGWKIVSEEWKPLDGSASSGQPQNPLSDPHATLGEMNETPTDTAATGSVTIKVLTPTNPQELSTVPADDGDDPAKEVRVQDIRVEDNPSGQRVCIELDSFAASTLRTVEGQQPRFVIDIPRVFIWDQKYRIPVNGRLIRQIRKYLHQDTNTLRVVLDFHPSREYVVLPQYDLDRHWIIVDVEEKPADTGT